MRVVPLLRDPVLLQFRLYTYTYSKQRCQIDIIIVKFEKTWHYWKVSGIKKFQFYLVFDIF